jgi:hypothetical protein
MKFSSLLGLSMCLGLLMGCQHSDKSGKTDLPKIDSTLTIPFQSQLLVVNLSSFHNFGYRLSAKITEGQKNISDFAFCLNYPVYHFELGDVNGDGRPEILLGVIKPTHFHPEVAKRLFIYKIDDGKIRPMWMGSQVSHPIVDFRYIKVGGQPFIKTIEKEKNNLYLVAEYEWEGFGLAIVKYTSRNLNLKQANEEFRR